MARAFPRPPLSLCRLAHGLAVVLLAAAGAVPVSAQIQAGALDGLPEVRAIRASTPIALDGRPDEGAWGAAPVFARFSQQVPQSGADATVRTEVRIVFDDEALSVRRARAPAAGSADRCRRAAAGRRARAVSRRGILWGLAARAHAVKQCEIGATPAVLTAVSPRP